jgi:hypothetical protein
MNEDVLEKIYSKKFQLIRHPVTNQKIIVPDCAE